ncbi:hypothetical protein OAV45_03715 [Candidatus Poseidoniales archaeon]|nr:hypothetical protein [Candidatus Poseidoniales archaeon]
MVSFRLPDSTCVCDKKEVSNWVQINIGQKQCTECKQIWSSPVNEFRSGTQLF